MEAQEESSNAKETWKMITAAGILGLYGNRQVPEKNPDPRNSPGLLVPALGHLSIAAQVLAGQKPSFLLSLSSSAALLPSLCFFLSLSPSLLSSTSSSPSFLLCLCYSSALFFSLFSPFLSGSPPFSPVSESACFGRLGAPYHKKCVDDCSFGVCVCVCVCVCVKLRSQPAACGPIGVNSGVTFQFG